MTQSRLGSFIESWANVAAGFILSLTIWTWIVVPVWHLPVNMGENLQITALFTVVSVARSYVTRRIFNARLGAACTRR